MVRIDDASMATAIRLGGIEHSMVFVHLRRYLWVHGTNVRLDICPAFGLRGMGISSAQVRQKAIIIDFQHYTTYTTVFRTISRLKFLWMF